MTHHFCTMKSPIGLLLLVGRDEGLTGLYMEGQRGGYPALPEGAVEDGAKLARVREQLEEYFAGERRQFDLPLAPEGTGFQRAVWAGLCQIPYGETRTYGELARAVGSPQAQRAVGLANGRNPIGIVVPCHRVIGASGKLVGYAGGMWRKQWLLEREGVGNWALRLPL